MKSSTRRVADMMTSLSGFPFYKWNGMKMRIINTPTHPSSCLFPTPRPHLLPEGHYPGEQTNQNVREHTPLVRLVYHHHRIPTQQKVLKREISLCNDAFTFPIGEFKCPCMPRSQSSCHGQACSCMHVPHTGSWLSHALPAEPRS